MSNPRFRPREHTSEPRAFGRAERLQWLPPQPGGEDQLVAAQIQHTYAVAITKTALRRYSNLKAYAEAAGIDYQRLSKLLSGAAVMRLEDIANAHRHLGLSLPEAVLPRQEPVLPHQEPVLPHQEQG
jgi:hypothetical protein